MAIASFTTTVIRPEDLLVLEFELVEVDFTPPLPGRAGRITGAANSFLVVHLQAQHIAEQAFFQATPTIQQSPEVPQPPLPPLGVDPAPPGEVQSRLGGPSRLVFVLPPGEIIDYTLAGLLQAMTRLPLSVAPVSAFDPSADGSPLAALLRLLRPLPLPEVAPPERTQTALEIPYRLVLSPDAQGRWQHALQPVTHGSRTELWHTRLGSDRTDGDPRLRAIWSPDFQPSTLQDHEDSPFRSSLDGRDRNELVHLTSNYRLDAYAPTPVNTERLMLTALGAWLRVQGEWNPPALTTGEKLTVELWRHDAAMGRDQYVRVVYGGYLFPFGHRASLVKVTERKFLFQEQGDPPGMVAYLLQRMFIVVREPVRSYTHRQLPFRTVTLHTLVTPDLADPNDPDSDIVHQGNDIVHKGQEAFWPRVASNGGVADFLFHLAATDLEDRTVELTTPLIFVSAKVDGDVADTTLADNVVKAYSRLSLDSARRQRDLAGQSIAFAPQQQPGDTTLETRSLTFGAIPQADLSLTPPHFLPAMSQAQVDVPAVKHLLGASTGANIEWEDTYLQASGQEIGNAGQVFTKLVSTTPLAFAADKAGGLVAPNINISGLSRALGPVGGPVDALVNGTFDPAQVFANIKLLGGIKLSDIIRVLQFSDAANVGQKLPQLISERTGNLIRTRYRWELAGSDLIPNNPLFSPDPTATFSLEAVVEPGPPPSFQITGSLKNFAVVLLPPPENLIRIGFKAVSFTAEKDKKPDVAVELGHVEFLGILAFVNTLSELIPLGGFQDPPSLKLVPPPTTGLQVGFSVGLPTVALGMMTMQNLSLAAAFFLPLVEGQPASFRFAFCERHQPFILTVSLFGGGGFFGIELDIHQVTLIEAALEFGASVALDLGVASGQVTVMGGFYFQKAGQGFQLTGYFRAAGSLDVLGIISVSCEFYLGLTYASKGAPLHPGKLWGQAQLRVEIDILFFSESVSISMQREFAGSDPTFRQLVAPSDWAAYCQAFAAYPAGIAGE